MKRFFSFIFLSFLVIAIAFAGGRTFRVEKDGKDVGSIAIKWEAPTRTNSGGLCYKIRIVNYSNENVSGLIVATGTDNNGKSAGFELGPKGDKFVYVFTTGQADDFIIPVINVK